LIISAILALRILAKWCSYSLLGRLAQLDRVQASEAWGRGFESHAAHQLQKNMPPTGQLLKSRFSQSGFCCLKKTPPYFTAKVMLASSLWYYDSQNPINTLNSSYLLTKISFRDI
jgi:ribonuclease I